MKFSNFSYLMLIACITQVKLSAATVNWYNSAGTELKDFTGAFLYEGPEIGTYDGDIIQLGYYTLATTASPFSGAWVALKDGTIGDKVNDLHGRYDYTSNITVAESLLGIPFVIRFYDSTTLETASFFNAVTDSAGRWNIANAPMSLSLISSDPIWQDGKISAFRTTISIPEPSSFLLVGLGMGLGLIRRCRRLPVPCKAE